MLSAWRNTCSWCGCFLGLHLKPEVEGEPCIIYAEEILDRSPIRVSPRFVLSTLTEDEEDLDEEVRYLQRND